MRPFDRQITRAYCAAGLIWEWSRDDLAKDLGWAVKDAWFAAFAEDLDLTSLPEPYDLLSGDLLYVMPQGRFIFINNVEGLGSRARASAEIRQTMPLFVLKNSRGDRVLSTFNARSKKDGLLRLAAEILPSLPNVSTYSFFFKLNSDAPEELLLEQQ